MTQTPLQTLSTCGTLGCAFWVKKYFRNQALTLPLLPNTFLCFVATFSYSETPIEGIHTFESITTIIHVAPGPVHQTSESLSTAQICHHLPPLSTPCVRDHHRRDLIMEEATFSLLSTFTSFL